MADIKIPIDINTSKKLLTAGKYCDKNILVTASGNEENLQILYGSFIPSEDVQTYTIEHNLGKIPRIACYFVSDEDFEERSAPTFRFNLACDFLTNGNIFNFVIMPTSSDRVRFERYHSYSYPSGNAYFSANELNIKFGTGTNTMYYMFKAGVEYQYFLVG